MYRQEKIKNSNITDEKRNTYGDGNLLKRLSLTLWLLIMGALTPPALATSISYTSGNATMSAENSSILAETLSVGHNNSCAIKTDGRVVCWGDMSFPPSGTFIQISPGYFHTCGLRTNGSIACWGDNTYGQSTPPAGTFSQVSAGGNGYYTCGLRTDGTIVCWGLNDHGETDAPAGTFTQISANNYHTCAIATDGHVACWGMNAYGESSPPVGTFIQVSAGVFHTCGVKTDGYVVCWGPKYPDGFGEIYPPADLGPVIKVISGGYFSCAIKTDGNVVCWGQPHPAAKPPFDLGPVTKLSIETFHACAVKINGSTTCWGNNSFGQTNVPSDLGLLSPRQVSAGENHTCSLKPDNTLSCWGDNTYGQSNPPAGTFTQVSSGSYHTCALKTDSSIACWGDNINALSSPPSGRFTQISSSSNHSCALKIDGSIACWGSDNYGMSTPPSGTFTQVSTGTLHACALNTIGNIQCWGWDGHGQATPPSGTFTQISSGGAHTCGVKTDASIICWGIYNEPPTGTFMQVSAGYSDDCALKTDGTVACWGNNSFGQGNAPTGTFTQVSTGYSHTCGVKTDGTVACWGQNSQGQAPQPAISPSTLSDASIALPYSQILSLADTGYISPSPIFELVAGAPPINLTLNKITGEISGIPYEIGTSNFTIRASDSNGFTAQQAYALTVNDGTPPVITESVSGALGSNDWYISNVNISWTVSDPDSTVTSKVNCDEPITQSIDTSGTTYTCTATSSGGTATKSVTIKRDATVPSLAPTLSPNPVYLNGTATTSANASDGLSGLESSTCDSVITTSIGSKTLNCTATDKAGNSANAYLSYNVVYNFGSGFSTPVKNPPVLNIAKAGRTIPFYWRVTDANGAPVSNLTSVNVSTSAMTCPGGTTNQISKYVSGNVGILKNLGNGYYQYNLGTSSSYALSCKTVSLNLGDGIKHDAWFQFTK